MNNKICSICQCYQLKDNRYICTNKDSKEFNKNSAPFDTCSHFLKANVHTADDLKYYQSLPLDMKISLTRQRIREWANNFGENNIYISFSGGKDSTVLLDIVRKDYPNIEAIFVNTGLEYPSIREFALSKDNVTELKPKMNFRDVIIKYGYPLFGKRQARYIHDLQVAGERNQNTVHLRLTGYNQKGIYCSTMKLPKKYLYCQNAPFFISDQCCDEMKKKPLKQIQNMGRNPIMGIMAEESNRREQEWKKNGCNAFDLRYPKSTPMAFWTEQDILEYIYTNGLDIANAYGEVVINNNQYETTKCKRTGCVFCGFGIEQNKQRFIQLAEQEQKLCDYVMRGGEFNKNGMWQPSKDGLGYWFVLEWLNVYGQSEISIPNKEYYISLYQTEKTKEYLN